MSCFWDGILSSLVRNRLIQNTMTIVDIDKLLKSRNTLNPFVTCNRQQLTQQQMHENYRHIQDYDISTINQGYLCSGWDPFLFLICNVFNVNIVHEYISTTFYFSHLCQCQKYLTLRFRSSASHFEAN